MVIVGGGPAGMACALRLSQLIDAHNAEHPEAQLSKENIYVLEKAREIGQHCLSGALLDPRSMNELLPEWQERGAHRGRGGKRQRLLPDAQVCVQGSTDAASHAGPRQLCDQHQPLHQVAGRQRWRRRGSRIFSGFAGSELLFDGNRVTGVRTDDKGVDRTQPAQGEFRAGIRSEIEGDDPGRRVRAAR